MTDALTTTEQQRLTELETTIHAGLSEFQRTGAALAEIRDGRLYRAAHSTFDDYLAARWGFTRQHAGRLIAAAEVAQVLEPVGYTPQNEHQARQAREAARIVQTLDAEQVQQVARFIQATTGSERPSTSQIKAVAEVVQQIDEHGTVEHPDNGQQVPFTSLPEQARLAVIRENVSVSTHERLQRQQGHIQASAQAQNGGKGNWADWCLNYVKGQPGHTVTLTIQAGGSGNPQARAVIHDLDTGEELASGDAAPYLKAAVLRLIDEVKS